MATKKGPGRPKTRFHLPPKAAAKRTKDGEERYIVILKSDLIERVKDLAYWDRLHIKEVFEEALNDRILKFENNYGELKKRPLKGKK